MLFDHHIHSIYSKLDSLSKIDDIISEAKKKGLLGIAISDHNTMEGSLLAAERSSDELIIIPSMEVSSLDGHIIALGVRESVERDKSAEETVDVIHDLRGLAIAAHPYDHVRSGVGDLCRELPFDAIEINGHCLYGNHEAKDAAEESGKPLVGGSDAHSISGIAAIASELKCASEEEILKNIRKGDCEPVYTRNRIGLKASIITDSLSRKYHLSRTL